MDIGVIIKKYRKEAGITASFFNARNSIIHMRCLAY